MFTHVCLTRITLSGSRHRSTPRPSRLADAETVSESEPDSECYLELELYHKSSDRLLSWRVHVRDVNDHAPSFHKGSGSATSAGGLGLGLDGGSGGTGEAVRPVYVSEAMEDLQVALPSAEDADSCRGQRALRYTLHCQNAHKNASSSSYSHSQSQSVSQASSILSASRRPAALDTASSSSSAAAASEQCPFELRLARASGRPLLHVQRALDRERRDEYSLALTAHDRGVPPRSATLAIRLHVRLRLRHTSDSRVLSRGKWSRIDRRQLQSSHLQSSIAPFSAASPLRCEQTKHLIHNLFAHTA